MKIRDSHATVNGHDEVFEMPSGGVDIIADDGQSLFSISLDGNVLRVAINNICKHEEKILDDHFVVKPVASNCANLIRPEYKK
jgi:hypothetical protein